MYSANESVASLQIICDEKEENSQGLSPWQGYVLSFSGSHHCSLANNFGKRTRSGWTMIKSV
jgi:hypothetical protein